jgi:hypothetical protein
MILRFEQRKSQVANPSQISGRRKAIRRGTINGETSMDPLFTTQYEICPRNPDTLFAVKRYDRITGVDKGFV